MGELGNFWQLGKLSQVLGKYERNGEECWDVGGKRKYEKMYWGRCGEVCLGCGEICGKCVGVGARCGESGKVWGGVENVGEVCEIVFGVWGGVGKCAWVWGKVWEMCWGRGNARKMKMQENVGRSRGKCVGVWGEVCSGGRKGGWGRKCGEK